MVYVDIKPMFCVVALFFLAAFAFSIEQSIALSLDRADNLVLFSFLLVLLSIFGYVFLREGLYCFTADEDGWYFRNRGEKTLLHVPWSDCSEIAGLTQASGDGTDIVFHVNRSAITRDFKPDNAHVSIEDKTALFHYSGFIIFQANKIRRLNALRDTFVART